MRYDFDHCPERRGTDSVKWDLLNKVFGKDCPQDCLALWVADMDFEVAPEIKAGLAERVEHGVFGYSCVSDRLISSAASWIERHYHFPVEKDSLVFSPGIVPALGLSVEAFTKPGDRILSLTPAYGPFFHVAEDRGRILAASRLIQEEGQPARIDWADLEVKAAGCKALLLCNPHNPTGRVFKREELQRLGELCLRHNLYIFSDEIHADFVFEGEHHPIASLDPRFAARSVTCFAPSKTFNVAGLFSSMIVLPDAEMRAVFEKYKNLAGLGGNLMGFQAMELAWTRGEAWLEELLVYLKGNRDFLLEAIPARVPGLIPHKGEACFLMWLDGRELMRSKGLKDSRELCQFFVKEGVAMNPGTDFGPDGDGWLRLNFGCPRATLEEALRRMEKALC